MSDTDGRHHADSKMSDTDTDTVVLRYCSRVNNASALESRLCTTLHFLLWAQQQEQGAYNLRTLLIAFNNINAKYNLAVHLDGEVIGCWMKTRVVPWLVRGDASPDDDACYPLVCAWSSIDDFSVRGLESLLDMPNGVTLKYIAVEPLATIIGWTPEAFVWHEDGDGVAPAL